MRVIVLMGLVFAFGCANQKVDYYLEAGGESVAYNESFQSLSFDAEGKGFSVGIIEESKIFRTKVTFFSHEYDPSTIAVNSTTDTATIEASGMHATLGFKITEYVVPRLYVGVNELTYTFENTPAANNVVDEAFVGYGIGIHIPISDEANLEISYDRYEFENLFFDGSSIVPQTLQVDRIFAGVSFHIGSIGGGSSK
jgi:hypothetical protein